MRGPTILARTMSIATTRGKSPTPWQYHSRSDSHSKVACWTLLFDLLLECEALRDAAQQGRIGFGINYEMVGPINKTLDLVVTILDSATKSTADGISLAECATDLGIKLDDNDRAELFALPVVREDRARNASQVAIALEAKACMTAHIKSLPRLHAEILATGYLARLAARRCITVSYSLVNAAPRFVTPSGTGQTNTHSQPEDTRRVLSMIDRAIPVATATGEIGYDVVGVSVIHCQNDGSPVTVVDDPTMAPSLMDRLHYRRMLGNICSEFKHRF